MYTDVPMFFTMKDLIISIFLLLVSARDNKAFNCNFPAESYKELLASSQERFVVSPLLANVAISMVSLGAHNETAEEMRTVLDLPDSVDKVKAIFKDFFQIFKNDDLYLKMTNIIYVSNNFKVSDNFSRTAKDIFGGQAENAYFGKRWTTSMLNEWIEKQTHFKFSNFFPGGYPQPCTFLDGNITALIINAIYFEAPWKFPFSEYIKSNGKFYLNSSYAVDIENMINLPSRNKFNYCLNEKLDAQILELPFKASNASMVLILPREKNGLNKLEDQMDEVLKDHAFAFTDIRIELPSFWVKMQLIDYKKVFKNSKLKKMFEPGEADLSGIAGKPKEIYFNSLLQKILFDVNAQGVGNLENVFTYSEYDGMLPYKEEFIADHPFMFYVKVRDLILFVGKNTGPTEGETNFHRQYKRIVSSEEKQIFLRL